MKKVITAVYIFLLSVFFIFSCKSESGEWVAKINGEKVTLDELNNSYYAQLNQIYGESKEEIDKRAADPGEVSKNPMLNKSDFLESMIKQRLVYNKAVEEGVLDNEEVMSLVETAKESIVVGYYIKEKFKDDINITEEEISKIYSEQKSRFRGAPIGQVEQYIRQQLMQQKLQMKLREYVEFLRDEGKIEKNLSPLKTNVNTVMPENESSGTQPE